MENPTVSGLRSRSRSKTPFLRSSCDRENCIGEGLDHVHYKTSRKTPTNRNTPVKQLSHAEGNDPQKIIEEEDEYSSPPAHRTRHSTRTVTEKLIKTSDYSSEESPETFRRNKIDMGNQQQYEYERVSTSSASKKANDEILNDLSLSPIHTGDYYSRSYNLTNDRSRFSPAYSGCSTDSSFAELALADASTLVDRDPRRSTTHLPSRLYKSSREYWNKYPKTDYTYSPLSRDRVELAPGEVAVPNMSRRSLAHFRVHGPNGSADELDLVQRHYAETSSYSKTKNIDSSDDEGTYYNNGGYKPQEKHWWLTQMLITIMTTITSTITTTTNNLYQKVAGPPAQYRYSNRQQKKGLISRTASAMAAPFFWIYSFIKHVTTTVTETITETVSPSNHVGYTAYASRSRVIASKSKRRWPWILLLLLPLLGYGSYYTYENYNDLILPNFNDFYLDLSEFTTRLPIITLPNVTMPEFRKILPQLNFTLPEINITLPDISDKMAELPKSYYEYKDIVQNRVSDASDYIKVVAESCYEELRRCWLGVFERVIMN